MFLFALASIKIDTSPPATTHEVCVVFNKTRDCARGHHGLRDKPSPRESDTVWCYCRWTTAFLGVHHSRANSMVQCGKWNVVQVLLDRGADIEARDSLGRKTLTLAVQRERQNVVRILIVWPNLRLWTALAGHLCPWLSVASPIATCR